MSEFEESHSLFCPEKRRFMNQFLRAIHEFNSIHAAQIEALLRGESDVSRFDDLLSRALDKKDDAKYAWITHVDKHDCEGLIFDAGNETRGPRLDAVAEHA